MPSKKRRHTFEGSDRQTKSSSGDPSELLIDITIRWAKPRESLRFSVPDQYMWNSLVTPRSSIWQVVQIWELSWRCRELLFTAETLAWTRTPHCNHSSSAFRKNEELVNHFQRNSSTCRPVNSSFLDCRPLSFLTQIPRYRKSR